ncbi:patatin-like phospholipase family protein [Crenobacter sp. SG2303]|uniref:Patatin-like phospholipase family protein n=1 Tax=Crenobacter oryzisoli TaxID=3056844 RepID=A0ABT7XIP0_9NEIS|nr:MULTISPECIES: patatin-like phospholipase family protein [unclassified Crenobacter]MDN0073653.1 patatin-like phospholipase family protein [Crenobacter sp. SG2303]MDN0082980.1 patatin-like phospholipase family protein [Crenobacter sp. SG2305]
MAEQQKNGAGHKGKREVVLVLQGGGALGAYHIGAYQALHEAGLEPDWVAGISIGAINAAVIAGNKTGERLAALDSLWDSISRPDETGRALHGSWLRWYNQYNVAEAMTLGQPNFWFPRIPSPLVLPPNSADQASFYDTSPMLATLRSHVNFEGLGKAGYGRLSVGATRVDTGELVFFDSDDKQPLGPEHVLASGSLPPGFPATRVGEHHYWDGGCVSNTPLNAILDDKGSSDLLVFMIDLWNAEGRLPTSMDEVAWRQKQIQYASRSAQIETLCQVHNLRHSVAQHGLKSEAGGDSATAAAEGAVLDVPTRRIDIVHIIYHPSAEESSFSDAEFSRSSIARRREAGLHDMKAALDHAPWSRPQLRAAPQSAPAALHRLQAGAFTSLVPR